MINLKTLVSLLLLIWALLAFEIPRAQCESEAIRNLVRRLDSKRPQASVQESASQALLRRLIPSLVPSFLFQIISLDVCHGSSCFILNNFNDSAQGDNSPEIIIKGTTGVELASGLHWYLKYWCGAHISWDKTGGTQLASVPKPGSLPRVRDGGVIVRRPVPWNYYQNVVTSSYSFVWWEWERWEKEIDWMALQGINLPLAFTGQESIWQKVFVDFNISKENLNDFFGGPAFLAWARMGNLHAWGGPLSQNWLDKQLALQKQILSRMVELGMTPVLPSFSGNVPAAVKKIFPSANMTRLGDCNMGNNLNVENSISLFEIRNTVNGDPRWCCTYLLDPSDPLFVELGAAFIKQQIKEYGDVTDIYNCDTFNENPPPTTDPGYISSLGAAVFKAMSQGDEDAVWLMQGWLFYSNSDFWKPPQMKALLHSVPFGKMIVLDLFADVKPVWTTSSQFYGTPYVWCLLHNFGGNHEMYGILDAVSSSPVEARISNNSTMVGVGMCMEGIEHNPVVFELMSEMAFRRDKVNVHEWLKHYSRRRYGKVDQQLETAWDILHRTIYNCTDGIANHNKDFIVKFPDWDPQPKPTHPKISNENQIRTLSTIEVKRRLRLQDSSNSDLPQAHLWYSTRDANNALKLFIDAGSNFTRSLTYRYDLVDLTRQSLSKLANEAYIDAITAFRGKDVNACRSHSEKFVELISDIDVVLASDDSFLLGTWLESAKRLAFNPRERLQYEWNARTQVTMWFDNTKTNQSKLHDYANKFWSGLVENYYLPRASSYFYRLLKSLTEQKEFDIEEWRKEWILFSSNWQMGTRVYPVEVQGDSLAISKMLYDKYFSS